MTIRKRVGVLISGRGSNLASLIEASRDPGYPAEIVLVLSTRPMPTGLSAKEADIPTRVVSHKGFPSREDFDAVITGALKEARVDLVAMRLHVATFGVFGSGVVRAATEHPPFPSASLRGLHPQARALEAGVRVSGATVHFVSEEMDAGPIIAQGVAPVEADDTEDTLAARILAMEHRLYPLALRLVASGAAWLENDRVKFASTHLSTSLWPRS